MSSIFGLLNKTSLPKDVKKEICGIQSWNIPYGRRVQATEVGENFYIGCCLDELDNTSKNNTPVFISDNCYYAIDALIYNREEIIDVCKVSDAISDEELLISYIKVNGLDSLKKVNGDFAGAIYNSEKNVLTLFRDHMGIRPLYYFYNKDFFTFSTDIRGITGILRANITLDENWIYKTLNGYIAITLENTEYADVFCIKPGSYLTFSFSDTLGIPNVTTYWSPGQNKVKFRSDKEYQTRLKELITDSVHRRLNAAPEPVGAELSGGLDSGVIGILINRLRRKCNYFSWSYSPEILPYAEIDERLVINDICKQENITCNYKHQQHSPDYKTPLIEYLHLIGLKSSDDYFFIDYALPAYINALTIKDTSLFMNHSGSKVIFSGHGGDEGVSHRSNPYEMFHYHEYYHYLRYMWSRTHAQKHRITTTIKNIRKNIRDNKSLQTKAFTSPFKIPELINPSFSDRMINFKQNPSYFAYDPVNYIKQGGSRNRLDNAALLAACCNVRYVFPYLDYRVIDYAVSIPRYQFLRGRRNRYIFREAFKDIIPESLYKVMDKDDGSRKNMKSNPNWYEDYINAKKETISRLSKNIWDKYLDYDKLNKFLNKDNPTREEVQQDYLKLQVLTFCIMAQNALDKSREVSQNLLKNENCILNR